MKKIKEMFKSAQSRYGSYSTLLVVIVVAIVIMINMVAGQLPENWKNIDLSGNEMFEISYQSKALLKSLDEEVEIHILANKETTDDLITTFVDAYSQLSSKVTVKWTDPELHPVVLTQNDAEADTIIVSCEATGKSTQILLSDVMYYDETSYYYFSYGYSDSYEWYFDADGQLTSAINYVVNGQEQKVYYTTGHGESTFSETITDLMTKSNLILEELNTLLITEIPEDCELLLWYAPLTDLSEEEKTMISSYLQEGGDMLLLMGVSESETTNWDLLLEEYGLKVANGYMYDSANQYPWSSYHFYPEVTVSGDMAENIQSGTVLVEQLSHGLEEVDPARDTISIDTFMSTSDNAYAITEISQLQGTYILGAVATEEESRFTVITTASLIDESLTTGTNVENTTLFMNAVTSNFDNMSNVSIEPISSEITYNAMQNTGVSALVVILVIPAGILLFGFVTWMKRRKA